MKKYIVKLSPEIIIKSKAVRKKTIKLLTYNISNTLQEQWLEFKIQYFWDQIQLDFPKNIPSAKINNILKKIFWIHKFFQVEIIEFDTIENIKEFFTKKYTNKLSNKTFHVRVKRRWTHSFSSTFLEREVGACLLRNNEWLKVSFDYPDTIVEFEIEDNKILIPSWKQKWAGWFPIWAQWKILSLISGWFDSGVSTYLSMKRWCRVDYLFFNLGWIAHNLWVKQVSHFLRSNYSVGHNAKFFNVNFDFLLKELISAPEKLRSVLLKRYMLKAASYVGKRNHLAIVKWDSLWQVSSQTLQNMHIIDKASDILTLRPLIAYDKQDIIDIAKDIGTAKFAQSMPEYCGAISNKQSASANEEEILECEKIIDPVFFEKIKENISVEKIKEVLKEPKIWEIQEIAIPDEKDVIIDIREESQKSKRLDYENEILDIPFFDINTKFEKLDQDKNYLLYCSTGVMSKLHGLYLREKWFENVKVLVSNTDSCRLK